MIDVIIEGFTLEVKYISSRSLSNATVARSRHRQYCGELIYVWSPDLLSITEKRYLGLPHALPSRRVPISGVEILSVDDLAPVGSGVFEYEYNSAVPTFRLRWTPNGTSWAIGAGWVSITGNGDFTITAPDSTTMTVRVTFALLPLLLGTPPATKSVALTITSSRDYQGHSRKISPAHSSVDIFDVTEYDSDGVPLNLFGPVSEADFSGCTLLNVDVSAADPFKFSYWYPTTTVVSGEALEFISSGPDFDATLEFDSDEDVLTTVIYEDGLPVPNDQWFYTDSKTVTIYGADYNSSAIYTVDYSPICRITTDYIDLDATNRTDYAWWADYALWERFESVRGEFETTVPVFFNLNTGRAYLDRRSTASKNSSRLYAVSSNRQEERTVPKRYWEFVDDFTIAIDVSQLQAGQFYLTHMEKRVYEESTLNVVFEHRSGGPNPSDCFAATWVEVEKNENISVVDRYHQLRLTVSGAKDDRDFRVRSMVMKGLKLHGSPPSVPAMTDIWGV
jgi:hypothetical protein